MSNETLILQGSPRIEIVFMEEEFEINGKQNFMIKKMKYDEVKEIKFNKGKIPWFSGLITAIIDLLTGHGVGQWKKEKGSIEIATREDSYNVLFKMYDREQVPMAIRRLKEKCNL
ncbi:hypothetical protein GWK08_16690 [Leptobacterium flavescens]|uniref:Uncharacterized protein n=1 Tax=Leptobacterium flavescens TaxID=472055 RepID=A0A6P0UP39_9FLAO|nr:hypothetical protein [Leptobacterium flavescens]NER15094.1 hypothetical protein [Leptobacterium flavescens]